MKEKNWLKSYGPIILTGIVVGIAENVSVRNQILVLAGNILQILFVHFIGKRTSASVPGGKYSTKMVFVHRLQNPVSITAWKVK